MIFSSNIIPIHYISFPFMAGGGGDVKDKVYPSKAMSLQQLKRSESEGTATAIQETLQSNNKLQV
jgi:hypothetical protein